MSSILGLNRDPRSYGQDPDVTWGGLMASFGLAITFQTVAIIAFSLLRRTFYGKQWLIPKRAVCPTQTPPDLHYDTLFGWIPQLMNVSEGQMLMYCGYDVVMFLKCLRLGFWTLAYFAPYALFVILPVNCVGHNAAKGYFVTTVSNIPIGEGNNDDGSKLTILSVHLVGICLFQFILMSLTLNLHLEYIQLRRAFMKQRAHDATVLVTDIPPRLQSSHLLKQYFEMIYGEGKVKKVEFMKHIEDLEKLIEVREKTVLMLERSILMDQSREMEPIGDEEGTSWMSDKTKKLREKLKEENQKVGELQDFFEEKELESRSLALDENAVLPKVMSSKFDMHHDNPLMTWIDVDEDDDLETIEQMEGEGNVEMMEAAEMIVLKVTGSSLKQPISIRLKNQTSTVLDLKRSISSESGIPVEAQVLKCEELELSNEASSMQAYGLKSGDGIEVEQTSNPSILAHGETSHSSRRQRLSVSDQYEQKLQSRSTDIWRRGTTLALSSPVLGGSSRKSPTSQSSSSLKPKGERLPLTGSLVDLLQEVRTAENVREAKASGSNSNKALVSFTSITAATIASQAVHSVPEHRQLLTVEEAPHSNDVFWPNMHKKRAQVQGLRALTSILTFTLIVFFVLPVTYLNQLFGPAKMESMATKQNWHWMLKSLTVTLLPMTLVIISNLLPPLFTGLGFFEGCLTWSLNGLRQFDRMMWFLLVNVYGVSIISGTIIESIVDILSNPTAAASIIADVLPTMSGFFIQYLIVKACVALMIEILRGLTVFHMVTRYLLQCKDATKRERLLVIAGIRRYNNPGWLPYGKHFPHILLVLAICLSFAPIAPLILIPGMIYFANAQLVYRYTLSYVYEPRFEVGGGFWPKALKWIVRIMYMSQGFMICIFLLRKFFFGVAVCFAMFYFTSKFGEYMSQKERNLLKLPLEVAVHLDENKNTGKLSKPIHLAHLHLSRNSEGDKDETDSEAVCKLRSKYIQPALIEARDIQPEEANIGKSGLWSTDPLHGGVCRFVLKVARKVWSLFDRMFQKFSGGKKDVGRQELI